MSRQRPAWDGSRLAATLMKRREVRSSNDSSSRLIMPSRSGARAEKRDRK